MNTTAPITVPIQYRVYSNGGNGGPVNYSTPVATASDLSIEVGPLVPGGRYEFGVRAYDPASDLEEANTDAHVRVTLDDAGDDVSWRPAAPLSVSLSRAAGGGCRVNWLLPPKGRAGTPQGFRVFLGQGQGAALLVAEVPFVAGRLGRSIELPGPFTAGDYFVEIEAHNGHGAGPRSERAGASIGLPSGPLLMGPVTARVI